jgi:hypothetical protein
MLLATHLFLSRLSNMGPSGTSFTYFKDGGMISSM